MKLGIWRAGGLRTVSYRESLEMEAYSNAFDVVDMFTKPLHVDIALVTSLEAAVQATMQRMGGGPPYALRLGYDHADIADKLGKWWMSAAWSTARKTACNWASGIIVSAHDLVKRWDLLKSLPTPVCVIPNGVPLNMFWGPREREKKKEVHVMAVGRLDRIKGLSTLVKAAARMNDKVRLTFVGEGPECLPLIVLADDLHVRLAMPGAVKYQDIPGYLRSADIFVMPSLSEGSPKALWEALATRLPCVVSRSVPDVMNYPVYIHEPDNVDSLSASLAAAIDGLGGWSGQAGRDAVESNNDLSKNLSREIRFLASLVELEEEE